MPSSFDRILAIGNFDLYLVDYSARPAAHDQNAVR
jgi:hypothetical protein